MAPSKPAESAKPVSLVENARQLREDFETHARQAAELARKRARSRRAVVLQDHRLAKRVRLAQDSARQYLDLQRPAQGPQDGEGIGLQGFHEELDRMASQTMFKEFYEQLTAIRTYHKEHPSFQLPPPPALTMEDPTPVFNGEEWYGKCLDLALVFQEFLNLSQWVHTDADAKRPKYGQYLRIFADFHLVRREEKNAAYRAYLEHLLAALASFNDRVHPLWPSAPVLAFVAADFARRWDAEEVEGWQKPFAAQVFKESPPARYTAAWFRARAHSDEYAADPVAVVAGGVPPSGDDAALFCQVCGRTFGSRGVLLGHVKGKKHRKEGAHARETALLEAQVRAFRTHLLPQIKAASELIEKKQTQTYHELQQERRAEEAAAAAESDESDSDDDSGGEDGSAIYNPKNVPLGYDGKPIPLWLHKLHGLNIEYKCEICGNESYFGPRAFQRHFQDARHAHGMRCLGIPNTQHFHGVTAIQEARELHQKLQLKSLDAAWNPDDEEFEDAEGTVFTKPMYEEFVQRGII